MKHDPLEPDVLAKFLEHATELHGAGRFDEAARLYLHVHERNPDALAAPYFLALMDIETGLLERALERLRYVTKKDPSSYEGQFALAYTFQELGHWRQAANAYRRALHVNPTSTAALFELANALEVGGKMDEAITTYRAAAAAPPTRLQALIGLARLRPTLVSIDECEEMRLAAADEETSPGLRIGLCYAVGPIFEALHRYDEAFEAFAKGNHFRRANLIESTYVPPEISFAPPTARVRHAHPDDVARRHAEVVADAERLFKPAFLARHAGGGHDSAAPIFIVGMPRSGSTLLEQILSSHDKVQGLGECPSVWRTINGHFPFVANAAEEADPSLFRRLAEEYLARQKALGWQKSPYLVDKMLGNYMNIGMIHLMFPRATILHSVRDPVDTCLACYRRLFRSGNETTYDLADIGAQYVRYRRMMAHWETVLPSRVVPVVHEDLVADPAGRIRWLVTQACNLKWDDNCLRFHQTKRPVRTASIAQVRQPIFRDSIERWRRYSRHLGSLMDALGPYSPRDWRPIEP